MQQLRSMLNRQQLQSLRKRNRRALVIWILASWTSQAAMSAWMALTSSWTSLLTMRLSAPSLTRCLRMLCCRVTCLQKHGPAAQRHARMLQHLGRHVRDWRCY